jgi:hypothetical protein
VRSEQHEDIVTCLLASDCWTPAELSTRDDGFIKAISTTDVPRLKRVGEGFYLNLWPEYIYKLPVDGELCEVPHISALNPALIEERFYPHHDRTHTHPLCLSQPTLRFMRNQPDQSPPPFRPRRTPVYIPTLPRYLDASISRCLDVRMSISQVERGLPATIRFRGNDWIEISYIIRYLYLENDIQRARLLPMLPEPSRVEMQKMLDKYVRKIVYRSRTNIGDTGVKAKSRYELSS